MLQNFKEEIIFSVLISFFMAFGMELYNNYLAFHTLNGSIVFGIMKDLWILIIAILILEKYIGHRFASFMTSKIQPEPGFKSILCMQTFTVLIMCPMMSLVATLLFKDYSGHLFMTWLTTFLCNILFAYLLQVLIAGPLDRWILKSIRPILNS